MTVNEARKIVKDFDERKKVTEDDEFMFIEALEFLIKTEMKPGDMMYLGGYYYEKKDFDLALKYYEMAAAIDDISAYECLGYIWYYGRTGKRDYEKAFYYFSKMMEKGHLVATYKVADMYKNGYYVQKDYDKYVEIIESLYPKVKNLTNLFDPVPEVSVRMAKIKSDKGDIKEAVNLYLRAKNFLMQRIYYNPFFGNLSIMRGIIDELYKLIEFDNEYFDFYDMYYLLKAPHKIVFYLDGEKMEVESVMEDGECNVRFNDKWFHNRDEFFNNACLDDERITYLYKEFYGFRVIE